MNATILAGVVYGIALTLVVQTMFKVIRKINHRRHAKLVARITAEVKASYREAQLSTRSD